MAGNAPICSNTRHPSPPEVAFRVFLAHISHRYGLAPVQGADLGTLEQQARKGWGSPPKVSKCSSDPKPKSRAGSGWYRPGSGGPVGDPISRADYKKTRRGPQFTRSVEGAREDPREPIPPAPGSGEEPSKPEGPEGPPAPAPPLAKTLRASRVIVAAIPAGYRAPPRRAFSARACRRSACPCPRRARPWPSRRGNRSSAAPK